MGSYLWVGSIFRIKLNCEIRTFNKAKMMAKVKQLLILLLIKKYKTLYIK